MIILVPRTIPSRTKKRAAHLNQNLTSPVAKYFETQIRIKVIAVLDALPRLKKERRPSRHSGLDHCKILGSLKFYLKFYWRFGPDLQ